jgi:hypothetical protein
MGNPATLQPKPFTSENQPANRGRKKGVPNRATVYKRLLKLKKEVEDPETGEPIKIPLYEAAALGQILAAAGGNTQAWKEIQDSLHGPIAQKHEVGGPDGESPVFTFIINNANYGHK